MNRTFSVSVVLGALSPFAMAQVEFTIFDTGVDNNNNLLAAGAPDSHWSVFPYGAGSGVPVVLSAENRGSSWVPGGDHSQWVSTADTVHTGSPGRYAYSQVFRLDGLDPNRATISGRWAGDDDLMDILINWKSVGIDGQGAGPIYNYDSWVRFHSFRVDSGFLTGQNVLTFVVNNMDNEEEGVIVDSIKGTATVPEPTLLLGLGVGLATLSRRRRR